MHTTRVFTPIDRTFQLFRWDQSRHTEPLQRISREDANYLLNCGFARRLSKYQLVLDRKACSTLNLRGESCHIKEHTILAAISGSERAQAVINSWAWA